ncbi:MAG TPA: FAD-binding oxidoreductase [Acetobacteraceae bacterium]|nr:FAD-binding oxidoreductase [Acetobacteraceae bacterium]
MDAGTGVAAGAAQAAPAATTTRAPIVATVSNPRQPTSFGHSQIRLLAAGYRGTVCRLVASAAAIASPGRRFDAAPMDTHDIDATVIGAGIAGATAAAALAADRRVALIEAEEAAGYHSTGRSAAMWLQNYGPPDVRLLSALSRRFFAHPPAGFADVPLMAQRTVVFIARADQRAAFAAMLAEGDGLRETPVAEILRMVAALRPGYAAAAAIEEDAFDMDVAALHQGLLRQLRARGGALALRHRAARIERRNGRWEVATSGNAVFRAPVVVNAAGAWGDEVAAIAGVVPIGLTPCRRTAAIIDPAPHDVARWPMLIDVGHRWYVRPEARTRLLVSPADETPMHAHDVQPDELDIATGIDRMQQALDIPVQRVERSWAGLRTFTPDGSLAFGWDRDAAGFLWCVGQGGYGIQTAPAAGRFVADLIAGRDPGAAAAIVAAVDPRRFTAAMRQP